MSLASSSFARSSAAVNTDQIVMRQTFPAMTARARSRGRLPEVTELAMPGQVAFVASARTSAAWRRRQRTTGFCMAQTRGRVKAIVSADPLSPPKGLLYIASVRDREADNRARQPFNGSVVPRGYLTTLDIELQGQELEHHGAFFTVRLMGTDTVLFSKSTGNGIRLGQPSSANERGVQSQDGWLAITPEDTQLVTLVGSSVLLEYELALDDLNGRKYLLEAGQFAIARPGATNPQRW